MIEFLEKEHIYLIDGIIVPSVTTILSNTIFKDKYKNVPSNILSKKAIYGSTLHQAIENLEQNKELPKLDYIQEVSLEQYKKLKKENKIKVKLQEQLIAYKDKYCGKYDMIANINGEESLVDIKTTAKLDEEYLSWQLSMYELAIGKKLKLYCIWLPKKDLGQLIEVKRKPKKDILKVVDEYEQTRAN